MFRKAKFLGPLFFLVYYVNGLLTYMDDKSILAYADHSVILFVECTWSEARDDINITMKNIAVWLALNKLSLNIEKTVFPTSGCYKDNVPMNIEELLDDRILSIVKRTGYLIYVPN